MKLSSLGSVIDICTCNGEIICEKLYPRTDRRGHWDLRYGGISFFFGVSVFSLKNCGITVLKILRYTVYLQFWTQKMRFLTKRACGITVLNILQCPPPDTVGCIILLLVAHNGAVWVLPVYMTDLGQIT